MTMFNGVPTYDKYRTLSLKDPMMRGEDVYALQCALKTLGFLTGHPDGILGSRTSRGIFDAQRHFAIVVDGLCGGTTQKAIALAIVSKIVPAHRVPFEALKGQLEHESGFRLGIYSPPRPDGNYDAGLAQRNTQHTPAEEGFDPALSVLKLSENTRRHYDLFVGIDSERRWVLAQGAWNAPAFACYIAREEGAKNVKIAMTLRPSSLARQTLEEYMAKVSKYN